MDAPLSWEQEQIWLHGMLLPELPLYTETIALSYRGDFNAAAFESSLNELCRRHELWRTTIQERDGTPRQVVSDAVTIQLDLFDFSADPEETSERRLSSLLAERARKPFDLSRGPLVRAFAVKCAAADTHIFLTLHHLLFDGASLRQIVLPELVTLYTAYSSGSISPLAAPSLQYADYASWQRADPAPLREAAMRFWQSRLADFSPLDLPVDRARGAQTTKRGASHPFEIDSVLAQPLLDLARRERTTAFSVLLASFVVLLARSCDSQDVTLGTVYGGRADAELERVIGCFLNILLLRTDLTGDPTFSEMLERVREVTLDALENADAPYQEVVRETLPKTSTGDSPVQAVFSFQPPSAALPAEWDLDVFAGFNGCAKFDLHLELEQKGGGFRGRLMYNTDLFDAATIDSLLQHWLNLIRAAIHAPETCIWKLPLLNSDEQSALARGGERKTDFPQRCMHDLFAQKAAEVPESIALSFQGTNVTYRQLDDWSAAVAHHLLDRCLGLGSVIGIMVERSPSMVAGLLGILRAGATYVPLDPTYPAARLEHMMRASGANLLLTQSSLVPQLPEAHPPILDIAGCRLPPATHTSATALPDVPLQTSAYIIFTSGSTGLPKGVEIPHLALTNLLCSMHHEPGIQSADTLLAVTSICFDIAALELFLPLIAGARIEIATAQESTNPDLLSQKLLDSSATIMQATPVSWQMLLENGWTCARTFKVLCGGEALKETLARSLLRHSDSVWNMYGPTETTIWSACVRLQPDFAQVTLGEPIANTTLFVLDTHKTLVPNGIGGELYIGGTGLARGYYQQPELTRQRFPLITLGDGCKTRLYRTGDRVKRMRDGSLAFLGRTDRQIKLNGFRIELGEIEQVLNSLPDVQESIVVQMPHPSHGEILAGFVVPRTACTLHVEELRTHLAKSLPKYMQPTALHVLAQMPLTLNGKLDRNRLPALVMQEQDTHSELPQPGTEQMLASIWCVVLGVSSAGRHDNFFDLGGHSLEAVRFVSLASRAFERKLPFASFIQGPTIAQFAQVVLGFAAPTSQLLKRGSSLRKQLLWIGVEPWLARFARHLDDDITLYAVTPDVEPMLRDPAACTIEAMAGQMIANIREIQPEGPYLLGSFCLRSLLAYELAQRLQADGEKIALLVLGDLYAPGKRPLWTPTQRTIRRMHREGTNLLKTIKTIPAQHLTELRRLVASWKNIMTNQPNESDIPCELLQALYTAELTYDIAPFTGKVLFLESGETRLIRRPTSRSWRGLIDDVEVMRYPGIHENVLQDPHLPTFARRLARSIDQALNADLRLVEDRRHERTSPK